jgi:hypothetical protein
MRHEEDSDRRYAEVVLDMGDSGESKRAGRDWSPRVARLNVVGRVLVIEFPSRATAAT